MTYQYTLVKMGFIDRLRGNISYCTPSSSNQKSYVAGTGLEDLMFKRGEIIDSRIKMLLSDIYLRRMLQADNTYRIYVDRYAGRNLIYNLDDTIRDRNRIELERKIIDLEQEKRMEQTSYLRDT